MLRRITATHVYRYLLCEHSATLSFHGDPDQSVAAHEGLRLLLDLGNRFEAEWVAEHCADWSTPEYPQGDWEAGLAATKALMRAGVPGILQGVLCDENRVGKPDLLRRTVGASELGDHHYIPGDVKSSARPHGEQIMQVLFYARLLEGAQHRLPEQGYLVLADGREEGFQVAPLLPVFDEVLAEIQEIRAGQRRTCLHLCHECASCSWRVHCRSEARERDDLSRISGVGRGLAQLLRQFNVETAKELALLAPAARQHLVSEEILSAEVLEPLQQRARAVVRGRASILSAPEVPPPPEGLYVVANVDPRRRGGLVLVSWLAVDQRGREERELLLAKRPEESKTLWQALLERVQESTGGQRRNGFRGAPIFHAGGLSPALVETIQAVQGGSDQAFRRVHDEGVDLSRVLHRSIAVPTPASGLRAYAAFSAPHPVREEADGPGREPEYGGPFGHYYPWHERWVATGEESWRRKIATAAARELDALRNLRLRLHEAAERARQAREAPDPAVQASPAAGPKGGRR